MTKPRVFIFDFDGTLTDAEEEGMPFTAGYLDDLAALTGAGHEEIEALAECFADAIGPDDGWVFQGQIVAPACVDPYLRIMPVARRILDHYGMFLNPHDREQLLDRILYKYNYGKSATVFRVGASGLLSRLPRDTTWVVTNSATEPVERKVRDLGVQTLRDAGITNISNTMNPMGWLKGRVVGNAKKYANDPDWKTERVPAEMQIPGLDRPILLRRRLYFETLNRLRREADVKWPDITVVGDIFELDLALPLHRGARVVLMANEHTPDYEVRYLKEHPNASVVRSIPELRTFLDI